MCKYVHKGTFTDPSDKSLNAYFNPDIPVEPGNTAAGKTPHTAQVHSDLWPAGRPCRAVTHRANQQ